MQEVGGPGTRRHPSVRALRKLGLHTALEAAQEMRGESIEERFAGYDGVWGTGWGVQGVGRW